MTQALYHLTYHQAHRYDTTWGLSPLALASSICVGFLYTEVPGKRPGTTASRAGGRNISSCAHVLSHFNRVQLCATLWAVAHQASRSMGFPRQEYWSGLAFPSPADLSNPGIKPVSQNLFFITKEAFPNPLFPPSRILSCLTDLNVITWPSMTQALVTDVMNGLKYSALTRGLRADSPSPKIEW